MTFSPSGSDDVTTHSFWHRRGLLAAIALAAGFAAGCGNNGQKPTYPVQGQLLYKGTEPAVGAMVVFNPIPADPSPTAIKPLGEVKEDGSFALTTYKADDGAPAGEYDVTVIWLQKPTGPRLGENRGLAKDRLEGRYSDPAAAKLKATVSEGGSKIRLVVE
jgi:hypothetical protein